MTGESGKIGGEERGGQTLRYARAARWCFVGQIVCAVTLIVVAVGLGFVPKERRPEGVGGVPFSVLVLAVPVVIATVLGFGSLYFRRLCLLEARARREALSISSHLRPAERDSSDAVSTGEERLDS